MLALGVHPQGFPLFTPPSVLPHTPPGRPWKAPVTFKTPAGPSTPLQSGPCHGPKIGSGSIAHGRLNSKAKVHQDATDLGTNQYQNPNCYRGCRSDSLCRRHGRVVLQHLSGRGSRLVHHLHVALSVGIHMVDDAIRCALAQSAWSRGNPAAAMKQLDRALILRSKARATRHQIHNEADR